ncbi:MAG TPA: amidohydrolase family protein [Castellaniella sp.]|uniref:amidohydrolase family protein n=1 Tax=Castellaniella sp. TaxID=1955812 RepID=UPI002EDE44A4
MQGIALDVHTHLIPIVPRALSGLGGVLQEGECLQIDGRSIRVADLFRPERLLAWMDQHGVRHAWVSVPPPAYRQHLPPEEARAWFSYLDTALTDVAHGAHGRLLALHHLPLEHPALALEFARRALEAGHRHFSVAAGGHPGICHSDPQLEPLWSDLGVKAATVFIHPGHCCDGRLSAFYLDNLLGNPFETAVAVSHLVLGGVCTRHPSLRFCLAHGGGVTAAVAGRLQRGYDTRRPGVPVSDIGPPLQTLRGFWVDSIVHDAGALALAAQVFGEDHVVFGSDWPFPMGLPNPQEQLAGLPGTLLGAVLHENAQRLVSG